MLLLALSSAFADCPAGTTALLPAPGAALGPGAQVMVEATGRDRERFESIRDGELVLASGGEEVPLTVMGTYVGSHDLKQWVLRAKGPVEPGRTWTVLLRGEPLLIGGRAAWFSTTAVVASGPPRWAGPPRLASAEREELGCGPEVRVVVEAPVASAPLVEATVRPAAGGYGHTVRLPVVDGKVTVGHGMCGGAFALEPGGPYLLELMAVDAVGRQVLAGGGPMAFTAP